jgi:gamma-glutamyltranspeptidase/glutathione hydrolase
MAINISTPVYAHSELTSQNGMVTAQHPEAARIGARILERGGNAVDAAVATAFATGVLLPLSNGIGGGGLMVIRMPDGSTTSVDFGMVTGENTSPGMFEYEDSLEIPGPDAHRMSSRFAAPAVVNHENISGYKSISTPGTVAGLSAALEKWGTFDLNDAIEPAAMLADDGVPTSYALTLAIFAARELISRFPNTAALLMPNGVPPAPNELFRMPGHARSLRLIAKHGPSVFYKGELAQATVDEIQKNGGVLTMDDFASYEAFVYEHTLDGSYRGLTLSGVPGANACSLTIEALQIVQEFELGSLDWNSPAHLHLLIEAFKLATVDRYTYLGDPALTDSPINALVHPGFAKKRAQEISLTQSGQPTAGNPWPFTDSPKPEGFLPPAGMPFDSGTTHLTVVDRNRIAVSLTQSNVGFSGVAIGELGVVMNNAMRWPETLPGTINSIYPRGRSVHNMSPLVIQQNGQLWGAIGSSGGRRIATALAQSLINVIDFGMSMQEGIQAPRVHVETDDVLIDGRLGKSHRAALESLGHQVHVATPNYVNAQFSTPNGIRDTGDGLISGVYPVNKQGSAAGI